MSGDFAVTERTQVRRKRDRAAYDRATVHAILDEGFVCHLGFAADGRPWAMPMIYGRLDDALYVHGAPANFSLSTIGGEGVEVCLTVTLVDGLVMSRSVFHHSVNYRSVLVFGQAVLVTDPDEQQRGFDAIIDHVHPGRRAESRALTPSEIRGTRLLRLDIVEASAKVRTGPPGEEPEDYALPYWGGVIPLRTVAGEPEPDEHVTAGIAPPTTRAPDAW